MSAQVTEAHIELAKTVIFSRDASGRLLTAPMAAQIIADSEARAVQSAQDIKSEWAYATMNERNQLRAERDYNHECINRLATATGTLGEKSERVVEVALSTIDQLRAEVERLKRDYDYDHKCLHEVRERCELWKQRAERAEAELAGIRALANRRNKRDHSQDTTHQLVAALDQALDIAQAELATERARIADLVADLNDACITLTSAEEDCDDYAMQNTRFKLTAVREVLLQHIPNAAMKEETK